MMLCHSIGVYLIVFNMKWMIGGDVERKQCLEYLDFWVNSVVIHTCDDDNGDIAAPIVFVGTHGDEVKDFDTYRRISTDIKEKFQKVWRIIIEYDDHVNDDSRTSLSFFPINNKIGQEDKHMQKLLKSVEEKIMEAKYIQELYPLTWLKCMDILKALSDTQPFISMAEVKQRCCGSPLIEDEEEELSLFLQFSHEMGLLMWHHKDAALKDIIILDPVKFFITPATNVICHYGHAGDHIQHRRDVHKVCEKQFPTAWNRMLQVCTNITIINTRIHINLYNANAIYIYI